MNEKNIIDNSTTPDMLQNNPTDIDSRITTGNDGKYSITIQYVASEGKVSTSHDRAAPGTTVTIVVLSNDGFQCNGVSVISGGVRVNLDSYSEYSGKIVSELYTFTMPSQNVVLQGNFKKIPGGGSSGGGGPSGGTDGDNTNPGGDGSNNGQGSPALPNVSGLVGDPFVVPHSDLYSTVYPNAGAHNCIYRGKKLGTTPTAEQYAAIRSGTFEDIFVGDYWDIGGRIFRIGGANYFLNTGPTQITKNHLVIVPDYILYNQRMNATNTTKGGYAGSEMDKTGLEQAKQIINAAFPGHVLPINLYLTKAVTNGKVSAGAWITREVFLMNEQMVYGGSIFTPSPGGTDDNTGVYRTDKSQLPLFQHRPNLITAVNQSGSRNSYWLRDVLSSSAFALLNDYGAASRDTASYAYGVRPAFCIG